MASSRTGTARSEGSLQDFTVLVPHRAATGPTVAGELRLHPLPDRGVDDQHRVDLPRVDVGEQATQSRPIADAPGEATIVVAVAKADSAFARLALDIRFGRLALRIERVERLLQSSSVDFRV